LGAPYVTMGGQLPEQEQARYASYLLRLWRVKSGHDPDWRASLECARTGERRGFANLTDLFAFLEKELSDAAQRPTAATAEEKRLISINRTGV
jgi:hypothetical protein